MASDRLLRALQVLEGGGAVGPEVSPRYVSYSPFTSPSSKKKKGGGGGPMSVLGHVLSTLDVPRAAVFSTARELNDLTGMGDVFSGRQGTGHFSLHDLWSQTFDPSKRIYGSDIVGGDNPWVRTIGGLGLDVAADPLTYVGVGAGARSGEAAGRIAEQGAKQIEELTNRRMVLDDARKLLWHGRAEDLAKVDKTFNPAIAARVREVQADVGEAIKAVRQYGPSGLSAEQASKYGVEKGLQIHLPGGKTVPLTSGEGVLSEFSKGRHAAQYKLATSLLGGEGEAARLGKLLPNANVRALARGAEDPLQVYAATLTQRWRGTVFNEIKKYGDELLGRYNAAKKGFTSEEMQAAHALIDGSTEAVTPRVEELAQRISKANKFAADRLVKEGVLDKVIKEGKYFPSPITRDTSEAMTAAGLWPGADVSPAGAMSSFERRRVLFDEKSKTWGVGHNVEDPETGKMIAEQITGTAANRAEAEKLASEAVGERLTKLAAEDPNSHAAIFLLEHPEIRKAIEDGSFSIFQQGEEALAHYASQVARRIAYKHAGDKAYLAGLSAPSALWGLSDTEIESLKNLRASAAEDVRGANEAATMAAQEAAAGPISPQSPLQGALSDLTGAAPPGATANPDLSGAVAAAEPGAPADALFTHDTVGETGIHLPPEDFVTHPQFYDETQRLIDELKGKPLTSAERDSLQQIEDLMAAQGQPSGAGGGHHERLGFYPVDPTEYKINFFESGANRELDASLHVDIADVSKSASLWQDLRDIAAKYEQGSNPLTQVAAGLPAGPAFGNDPTAMAVAQADRKMSEIARLLDEGTPKEGGETYIGKLRAAAKDLGIRGSARMDVQDLKAALREQVSRWKGDRADFGIKQGIYENARTREQYAKDALLSQEPFYRPQAKPQFDQRVADELKQELDRVKAEVDPQREATRQRIKNLEQELADAKQGKLPPTDVNPERMNARISKLMSEREDLARAWDLKRELDIQERVRFTHSSDAADMMAQDARAAAGRQPLRAGTALSLDEAAQLDAAALDKLRLTPDERTMVERAKAIDARLERHASVDLNLPGGKTVSAKTRITAIEHQIQAERDTYAALTAQRNEAIDKFTNAATAAREGTKQQGGFFPYLGPTTPEVNPKGALAEAAAQLQGEPDVLSSAAPKKYRLDAQGNRVSEIKGGRMTKRAPKPDRGEFSDAQRARVSFQEEVGPTGPTGKFKAVATKGDGSRVDVHALAEQIQAKRIRNAESLDAVRSMSEDLRGSLREYHDGVTAMMKPTSEKDAIATATMIAADTQIDTVASLADPAQAALHDQAVQNAIDRGLSSSNQAIVDAARNTHERIYAWNTVLHQAQQQGDDALVEIAHLNKVAAERAFQAEQAGLRYDIHDKWLQAALNDKQIAEEARQYVIRQTDDYMNYRQLARGVRTPNEIADQILHLEQHLNKDAWPKFWQGYAKLVNWMKRWQIATPGFHIRNTFGGVWNNSLADVPFSRYPKFIELWKNPEKDPELWDQIMRAAGHGQSLTESGFGNPAAKLLGKSKPGFLHIPEVSAGIGGQVEFFLRGSLAMDVLERTNGSIDEAVRMVHKFHFNYDDLSRADQWVKQVIPFYTFTRNNLPLQVEQLLNNPKWFARYAYTRAEIEKQSGADPIVPGYFAEIGALRLPWTGGGGHKYLVPDLPLKDLNLAASPLDMFSGNGGVGERTLQTLSEPLSQVTPVIAGPLEWMLGRQFYKGIPLRDDRPVTLDDMHVPSWMQPILHTLPGNYFAKSRKTGKYYMTERDAYIVDKMVPLLARFRRGTSGEKKYSDNRLGWVLSFFLGTQIRSNTKEQQKIANYLKSLEPSRQKTIDRHLGAP